MKAHPVESQLQLHDFKNSTNEFTFIPYGLDSKLSKEAVKVHVLHGRKRQKKSRSKQDENLQGQMFAWDSKTISNQQSRVSQKSLRGSNASRDSLSEPQSVAFMAQLQHTRHVLCEIDHILSMDHQILRNPFADRIIGDLGRISDSRLNSMNYLVDHCKLSF